MKRGLAILFAFSACIAACHKSEARRYVALRDVPIYREPLDGTTDVVYTVKKGETCVFGREVTKKVYLFKEVTCGNAHGWTPDWADFDEVKEFGH